MAYNVFGGTLSLTQSINQSSEVVFILVGGSRQVNESPLFAHSDSHSSDRDPYAEC